MYIYVYIYVLFSIDFYLFAKQIWRGACLPSDETRCFTRLLPESPEVASPPRNAWPWWPP